MLEENEKPGADIAPVEDYEAWKKERAAFFEQLREIQERVNLTPEEADQLASEAVQAVRNP